MEGEGDQREESKNRRGGRLIHVHDTMKPRPNISPFPFFFYYYWLLILVCCASAASAYRGSDGERCDERYASIRGACKFLSNVPSFLKHGLPV